MGRKGFTLIELLIVSTMLGLLAYVGLPTLRRMTQKSKQFEAKEYLGNIYAAEWAFRSEQGMFGNNMRALGTISDAPNRLYTVGWTWGPGTCVPAFVQPTGATIPGVRLMERFPAYWNSPVTLVRRSSTVASNGAGEVCFWGNGILIVMPQATGNPLDNFLVQATGNISPRAQINSPLSGNAKTPPPYQDVWVIDERRFLQNVNSGIE